MSGVSVNVNITGDTAFINKLSQLSDKLNNFSEAFGKLGPAIDEYASGEVFRTQGGVYGTPWAKLSPKTQAFKLKHFRPYATTPLVRTSTMRDSFRYTATPKSLVIYNDTAYFKYHQSSAPRHVLPRRQMLGINDDVKNLIKTYITSDINSKIEDLGLV